MRAATAWLAGRLRGRRRLLVVMLLLGVVATAVGLLSTGATHRPDAKALAHPNIVLVLTDDQSLESVSRMPYVSGRDDWVTFDNAFLNVALCCPSRATILSGQYAHHTGVNTNQDGAKFRDGQTVATWLRDGGYRTGLVGKYLNGYPWGRGTYVPPGWDEWRVFEGVDYFDYTLNENGVRVKYGDAADDYSTDVLARRARDFIARQTGPFLLVLAPNAPHRPRTAAPRHQSEFTDSEVPRPASFNEADVSDKPAWIRELEPQAADEMDRQRRKQYRSLLAVDDMVKEVFASLTRKGVLDETVVFFMTDNGFSFGAHRHVEKTCPYEECIRTPLLVRYPGQGRTTVEALVQNVDLAPTFADLAGVTPGIPQDGRSLVPLLRGISTPWRDGVLLGWAGERPGDPGQRGAQAKVPAFRGVRTERYKYIELSTGEKELYDLRDDPNELENRSGDPSFAQTMAELSNQLAALRDG